ncbi:MAG: hypothetical protein LCH85_16480 [Chloroflexi bacterium]|nr:hypothetical protein [Chloroflexota bacterium]
MTQAPLQWNDTVVHDLLHYPQRLLQHDMWATIIAEAGGLPQMRQQLLDFPLKAKERRVLEVILTHPEASVVRYTDLLAMHHATFHRQQNALCRSLSHFLNLVQIPTAATETALPVAPQSEVVLPWTSFVGRQADLEALHMLLIQATKWISLVGTGGVGKTRLALELAQRWLGAGCDEVHVLRFADVQRIEDIGLACVQQLQLSISDAQSIEQAIQQFFENRRSLLILDNLEHLPAAGLWLANMLQALPQQQVLATSRVRLNVPNESIYHVVALAYPPAKARVEQSISYPAVQLCLDRMEAVRLVDRSDAQLLTHVGQVCRHVAGLPLAIELVAARAAEYPLETIVAAVSADLGFLAEGPLDVDARQQTMAATIGWSYRLLPAETQVILNRLSVFQAGWDVAAAAALCGLDHDLMEDHLSLLLDNHLINLRDTTAQHPYTILEPIRQYAWQLLTIQQQQSIRLQHCDYYTTWVIPTEEHLTGPDHASWGLLMLQAYPNIQLALATARSEADQLRFWQLSGGLCRFWWNFQLYAEAQTWVEPIIPTVFEASPHPYWQCRVLLTVLVFFPKDTATYSRKQTYNRLIDLTQHYAFEAIEARAKNFYALLLMEQNQLEAAGRLFLDVYGLYQRMGDNNNLLTPLFNYANLMWKSKKLDESYAMFQDLVIKYEQMGYYEDMFACMKNISQVCVCQKNYHEAEKIIFDVIERSESKIGLPLYLKDFNLYLRLIKIYVFLQRENDLDWCIKILYPITIESTFFVEKVFVMCEALIYLAIFKEYQLIALQIYQYLLNIIHSEQYAMRWNESEFLAQTQIILSQHFDDFDFVADNNFCLEYNDFNATMNYYLKIIYGF